MNLVLGLLGALALAVIGFFYMKSKRDSAEALLVNQEVKEKLTKLNEEIARNNGNLASEEDKRKATLEEIKEKQDETTNVVDFFNNRNNKS